MGSTDTLQEHLNWLQDKLADYESELTQAETAAARLRPIVANLRGTIEALAAEHPGIKLSQEIFGRNGNSDRLQAGTYARSNSFAQGNRNPDAAVRRAEYANMTLLEAAENIVNAAHGPIALDTVFSTVFEPSEELGERLAKKSMASSLYRGAKRGYWKLLEEKMFMHN